MSRATIAHIERGDRINAQSMAKALGGLRRHEADVVEARKLLEMAEIEIAAVGCAALARALVCDPSNLAKSIAGQRAVSKRLQLRLSDYFLCKTDND